MLVWLFYMDEFLPGKKLQFYFWHLVLKPSSAEVMSNKSILSIRECRENTELFRDTNFSFTVFVFHDIYCHMYSNRIIVFPHN